MYRAYDLDRKALIPNSYSELRIHQLGGAEAHLLFYHLEFTVIVGFRRAVWVRVVGSPSCQGVCEPCRGTTERH